MQSIIFASLLKKKHNIILNLTVFCKAEIDKPTGMNKQIARGL